MLYRSSIGALAVAVALGATVAGVRAFDEAKYPDWRGQWVRLFVPGVSGNPSWDPHKSEGRAQQAPLTPEYQAIHEASLADQRDGGAGLDRDYACYSPGMPRMMNVYSTLEIVIQPDTTHMMLGFLNDLRRIYTDGRTWPEVIEPTLAGYSIGTWIDEDGDGRYDVLAIETRGFRGIRTLDSTGLPLHRDNETVIKERIYSDKSDANILRDEITLFDHALTHPWTVTKSYRRTAQAKPQWAESKCAEDNGHIRIGEDSFMLSHDGLLMPTKKGQAPPDLRYFGRTPK
jgi:hypothetical protein